MPSKYPRNTSKRFLGSPFSNPIAVVFEKGKYSPLVASGKTRMLLCPISFAAPLYSSISIFGNLWLIESPPQWDVAETDHLCQVAGCLVDIEVRSFKWRQTGLDVTFKHINYQFFLVTMKGHLLKLKFNYLILFK